MNIYKFRVVCFLAIILMCAGCSKDKGSKTGTIKCGEATYSITIGEVKKNDAGNTYVSITGDMPALLLIRDGEVIPYLGMRIIVDNRTVEMQYFSANEGEYAYSFSTKKDPGKIIIYSNVGASSTLTFDGKTRTVIE